jgi:hypothetical protein
VNPVIIIGAVAVVVVLAFAASFPLGMQLGNRAHEGKPPLWDSVLCRAWRATTLVASLWSLIVLGLVAYGLQQLLNQKILTSDGSTTVFVAILIALICGAAASQRDYMVGTRRWILCSTLCWRSHQGPSTEVRNTTDPRIRTGSKQECRNAVQTILTSVKDAH